MRRGIQLRCLVALERVLLSYIVLDEPVPIQATMLGTVYLSCHILFSVVYVKRTHKQSRGRSHGFGRLDQQPFLVNCLAHLKCCCPLVGSKHLSFICVRTRIPPLSAVVVRRSYMP